jgi:hypothetical protein
VLSARAAPLEPSSDTSAAATLFNMEVQKEWRRVPSEDMAGVNVPRTVALYRRAVQHDRQARPKDERGKAPPVRAGGKGISA